MHEHLSGCYPAGLSFSFPLDYKKIGVNSRLLLKSYGMRPNIVVLATSAYSLELY